MWVALTYQQVRPGPETNQTTLFQLVTDCWPHLSAGSAGCLAVWQTHAGVVRHCVTDGTTQTGKNCVLSASVPDFTRFATCFHVMVHKVLWQVALVVDSVGGGGGYLFAVVLLIFHTQQPLTFTCSVFLPGVVDTLRGFGGYN